MDLLQRANELMVKIAAVGEQIAGIEARAEEEVKKVQEKYKDPLAKFSEIRAALDDELIKMMKLHKADLFERTDQVTLAAGLLLYGEEAKVRIPRDALGKIKEAGWLEAIKTVESVDRGVVEKWPLERVLAIGGDKKVVEVYSYEIKNGTQMNAERADRR